jgi:hypothetical protein
MGFFRKSFNTQHRESDDEDGVNYVTDKEWVPRRELPRTWSRFGRGRYLKEDEAAVHEISHQSVHDAIRHTEGEEASEGLDRKINRYGYEDETGARRGFSGIISKKQKFIIGESGPEHVRRTPLKKYKHESFEDELHRRGLL